LGDNCRTWQAVLALSNAYKIVEREAIILAELVDILPSGDYQRLID
jgi:hypothetical protein